MFFSIEPFRIICILVYYSMHYFFPFLAHSTWGRRRREEDIYFFSRKKKFIDLLLDDVSPRIYSMCCKKRAVVKIDAFSGLLKDFVTVKILKNVIQLHNIFIIIISYMEINSRQLSRRPMWNFYFFNNFWSFIVWCPIKK